MGGVYVHIPFCGAKCYYCNFYSGPLKCDHKEYVDCLFKELEARSEQLGEEVRTVYVGGGTPSKLQQKELQRLLQRLAEWHPEEFTVEVNPEDVDEQLAELLVRNGVNRVSMGVQSLNDSELKAIGRRHNAAEAVKAMKTLREGGIRNLSVDLIYGLPDQDLKSWAKSLEGVLSLNPEHVSAYSLSYEPGTLLWTRLQTGKIEAVSEEVVAQMYEMLCRRMREAGFLHYEISNFGKEGFLSQHNSAYWKFAPYLGVGAGAHSFMERKRFFNPSNLKKYMADCVGVREQENLSREDLMNEFVMVGLRTSAGVDLDVFAERFGERERRRLEREAEHQIKNGNVVKEGERIRIPEERWLVSDSIIVAFFC